MLLSLSDKDILELEKTDKEMLLVVTKAILLGMYNVGVENISGIKNYVKELLGIEVSEDYIKVGKEVLLERKWITKKSYFTNKGKNMIKKILNQFMSV